MAQGQLSDVKSEGWDEFAKLYRQMTSRVGYGPIGKMLERANALLPFAEAEAILDNGCGPGPITRRLLQDYQIPDECSLTCADFSEGMVKQVLEQKGEEMEKDATSPWGRLDAFVQDATDLKDVQSSSKSHVLAGWVYFMTPDPARCLTESRRVLQDGGVLSCSSWQGSQWLDLMNLLRQVRPDKNMPEIPADWRDAGALKGEMERAGFQKVECHEVATQMEFERLETLVDFLMYKMPHMQMLLKDVTEEETSQLRALMLSEGTRMAALSSGSEAGILHGTSLVAVGKR